MLLVLLSHLSSVGAGIKMLMEMKWYVTHWAMESVSHRQLKEKLFSLPTNL